MMYPVATLGPWYKRSDYKNYLH